MQELNKTRISVAVHAVVGLMVAYITTFSIRGALGGALGIVVLLAIGFALERGLGKKGIKWWFANGIFIYLFMWLVGIIYFFNLGL